MRKNFNTTIDEQTIELIEKLAVGKSKGQVVDEAVALLAAPSRDGPSEAVVNRWFRETWKRLEDLPAEILEAAEAKRAQKNGSKAVSVPPTSGAEPESVPGFQIQCLHCGNRGHGATKFATLCFECKLGGHTLQPSECPVCTAGQAI